MSTMKASNRIATAMSFGLGTGIDRKRFAVPFLPG